MRRGELSIHVETIAGATVRLDEAARLVYRHDGCAHPSWSSLRCGGATPVDVAIALDAPAGWSVGLARVRMMPGDVVSIPIAISVPDGATSGKSGRLHASLVG